MKKISYLLFSAITYVIFFLTLIYFIGFVQNIYFEKTIDRSESFTSPSSALIIDICLLLLFGLQHSLMARKSFKEVWTKIIPHPIERSTYVLITSVVLHIMIVFWQPIHKPIWNFSGQFAGNVFQVLSWFGWSLAVISTFSINHFHLFGLFQTYKHYLGLKDQSISFKIPFLYKLVRHPLYLGFLIAFWFAPIMTAGHLLFAIGMTTYILIGIKFEEKDLTDDFGKDYEEYKRRVPKILPLAKHSKKWLSERK